MLNGAKKKKKKKKKNQLLLPRFAGSEAFPTAAKPAAPPPATTIFSVAAPAGLPRGLGFGCARFSRTKTLPSRCSTNQQATGPKAGHVRLHPSACRSRRDARGSARCRRRRGPPRADLGNACSERRLRKTSRRAGPAAHRPRRHDQEASLRPRYRRCGNPSFRSGTLGSDWSAIRIILLVTTRFDDDQRYPMPVI